MLHRIFSDLYPMCPSLSFAIQFCYILQIFGTMLQNITTLFFMVAVADTVAPSNHVGMMELSWLSHCLFSFNKSNMGTVPLTAM